MRGAQPINRAAEGARRRVFTCYPPRGLTLPVSLSDGLRQRELRERAQVESTELGEAPRHHRFLPRPENFEGIAGQRLKLAPVIAIDSEPARVPYAVAAPESLQRDLGAQSYAYSSVLVSRVWHLEADASVLFT